MRNSTRWDFNTKTGKHQFANGRHFFYLGLRQWFCFIIFNLGVFWRCQAASTNDLPVDPAHLKYNLSTLVGAYEKAGKKDPRWDADVKKCLTTFARIRSWTNDLPVSLVNEFKTNLVHLAAIQCDDPLIRYLYVRTVFAAEHSEQESVDAYVEAATAMKKSDYPDIRKFYAVLRANNALVEANPRQKNRDSLGEEASGYLALALQDKAIPLREADQATDQLMISRLRSDSLCWNFYNAAEKTITNRWGGTSFALLVKSRAYIASAWLARGHDYADKVSSIGWDIYKERLETAAESLEAAWKLNPHDDNICYQMMRVELGQGEGRSRLETWFQRGMKLRPDGRGFCEVKLEYLRPRWYGSWDDMIDFGRECTLNTNWSGSVRLMLADAHNAVSKDFRDAVERDAYWHRTNVWPDIQLSFEQFFKLYPKAVGYRHDYARYAYWCGQWDVFLHQAMLFPSTNYSYFGGEDQFNTMVKTAAAKRKGQAETK